MKHTKDDALKRDAVLANIAGWLRHLADDVTIPYFTNGAFKADCNEAADVLLATPPAPQSVPVKCWCHKCNEHNTVNGLPFSMTQMILCPECGNKRCPKASDHQLDCTGSNEAGQHGSVYTAPQPVPVQEPVAVVSGYYGGQCVVLPTNPARLFNSGTAFYTAPQPVPVKTYHDGKPWPVAPKPWVGLSRDEVLDIEETTTHPLAFYQAIEAKLKEKNT
jgi:hypothetical protein